MTRRDTRQSWRLSIERFRSVSLTARLTANPRRVCERLQPSGWWSLAMSRPPLALLKAILAPYGARLRRKRSRSLMGMCFDGWGWRPLSEKYYSSREYSRQSSSEAIVPWSGPSGQSYSSSNSTPFGGLFDSDYFYWWGLPPNGLPNGQLSSSVCR